MHLLYACRTTPGCFCLEVTDVEWVRPLFVELLEAFLQPHEHLMLWRAVAATIGSTLLATYVGARYTWHRLSARLIAQDMEQRGAITARSDLVLRARSALAEGSSALLSMTSSASYAATTTLEELGLGSAVTAVAVLQEALYKIQGTFKHFLAGERGGIGNHHHEV